MDLNGIEAQMGMDNMIIDTRDKFCDCCALQPACAMTNNDEVLSKHIVTNEEGAFTCDVYIPIIFQFHEKNFTEAQKQVLAEAKIEFGKNYMLAAVKDVVMQLKEVAEQQENACLVT